MPPSVIVEGLATAATIHEATNRPVVVAFSAHNLKAVAEAVRESNLLFTPASRLMLTAWTYPAKRTTQSV